MKIKVLAFFVMAAVLTGCINTVKHIPLGQTVNVYRPTSFVACDAVGVWWNDSYCGMYPIEAAWMKLTWLVWVVDLPCEVVMDTIWFPYDFYCMKRYEKYQAERKAREGKSRFGSDEKARVYSINGNYSIDIGD